MKRTSRPGLVMGVLSAVTLAVLVIACRNSTPPVSFKEGSMSPQERPDYLPKDVSEALGCESPFTICVNACTGEPIHPGVVPNVAEGQQLKVRAIGWESCRPSAVSCNARDVASSSHGFPAAASSAAAPVRKAVATPEAAKQLHEAVHDIAPPAAPAVSATPTAPATAGAPAVPAVPAAPAAALATPSAPPEVEAAREAKGALKKAHDELGATPATRGEIAQVDFELDTFLQLAGDSRTSFRTYLQGTKVRALLDALERNATLLPNQRVAVGDAKQSLDQAGVTKGMLTARIVAAQEGVQRASTRVQAAISDLPTQTVVAAKGAIEKYRSELGSLNERRDEFSAQNVDTKQAEAVKALSKAEQAARQAAQGGGARATEAAIFGDCVLTVPAELSLRQVVVKMEFTRPEPPAPVASAAAGGAGAGGAGDGTAVPAAPSGGRTEYSGLNKKDVLVYVNVDHGKYYYDVGLLTAFVPYGQRTIATPRRAGTDGDYTIAVSEQAKTVTGIALNVYPWGHRRGAYSFLDGKCRMGDLLGLQVAFNPDLKEALSSLFGGIVIEPVTGLSANLGVVRMNGDFLRSGYAQGMSPTSNRDDYVVSKPTVRMYLGLTIGFELFHTTASRVVTPTEPDASKSW